MELGQRIKAARLEKGLSQRQLCGDVITRNMLSLIENGSARPSMDTLQYLARQLEKPIGYFLAEDGALSANAAVMARARQADPAQVPEILEGYQGPDKDFDAERFLLEVHACFALAQQALNDRKPGLAQHYLAQAAAAGAHTPYYTEDLERRRLLLLGHAGIDVEALLPDHTEELLLRARAALGKQNYLTAQKLLDVVNTHNKGYHTLQAEVYFAQQQYKQAAAHYQALGDDPKFYSRLEICYRELGSFEKAYYYACKQR